MLRTSRILDGRGGVLEDRDIVIRGGEIAEIVGAGQGHGDRIIDLTGYTVLPGLIDTHVHIGWHFGPDGRLARRTGVGDRVMYAVENAQRMLHAGITTVQSLGGAEDGPLARAFERGVLEGPRVITSLGSISASTGGPAELRAAVRDFAERGAGVIKIFGSESIRTGGAPTMSQDQLDAACGEAADLGLRAVVHAHGPESARRSTLAGCTTIEHGALLDRTTLELMAAHGTFYDPNIHLIFQNYFDNEDRNLGIGRYTAEGFGQMRARVPRGRAAVGVAARRARPLAAGDVGSARSGAGRVPQNAHVNGLRKSLGARDLNDEVHMSAPNERYLRRASRLCQFDELHAERHRPSHRDRQARDRLAAHGLVFEFGQAEGLAQSAFDFLVRIGMAGNDVGKCAGQRCVSTCFEHDGQG